MERARATLYTSRLMLGKRGWRRGLSPEAMVYVVAPGGARAPGGIGRLVRDTLRHWRDDPERPQLRLIDSRGPYGLVLAQFYFARALLQIAWNALRGRIAVLHVHAAAGGSALRKGIIVQLASRLGVPTIVHLHGSRLDETYPRLSPLTRGLLRRTLGRADRIIAVGEHWRRVLIDVLGIEADSIVVVPNAVAGPNRVQRREGGARPCRLLFLGTLSPEKGVPELLAALADERLRGLDWCLRLAGDGDAGAYAQRAAALGIGARVEFCGVVPEKRVEELLAEADVFVLPSHNEGLSMAMLEAMANGCAVVTTPAGAALEAVSDELSALVTPVGDPARLAVALQRSIADERLRANLQAAARARFCEAFDIELHCRRLDALYRDVRPPFSAAAYATSGRRKRWWLVLYPLYLLLWLVSVHYIFFWRPFLEQIRYRDIPPWKDLPVPRHVEPLTMQRLGSLSVDRRDSFVNFSEAKADGMTRVCTFGDSFTYGSEVGDGHDYPSFLQDEFRKNGYDRVEVINFGSGWHGFHQTYVLWDEVGRRFDCDYVLFGPASFQYDRDTTFNHSQLKAPYYLHARYVLDGDDVRLLEVPGGSAYASRFANYFRLLPHWQYLHYDRNLPTLLAALPRGRTLPNPFYYFWKSRQTEAVATYERLLRKVAQDAPRVLLLHENPVVIDAAKRVARENLVAALSYTPSMRFPYRAPEGHYSSFGNLLVARQYFNQLVDAPADKLSVVETRDPPEARAPASADPPQPLSNYDGVEIRAGEKPIGYLLPAVADPHLLGGGSAAILKERNVAGLLTLKSPSTCWVDATYAEIDFMLHQGDEVVLRASDGTAADIGLGVVRMLDPRVNVGAVELPDVWYNGVGFVLVGDHSLARAALGPEGTPFEIWIADHKLLSGNVEQRDLPLSALKGQCQNFRVSGFQFADLEAPQTNHEFDLVLRSAAQATRIPIATWELTEVPMPHPDAPVPGRLARPHAPGSTTQEPGR